MPELLRSNILSAYSIELSAALFAAAVATSWGAAWIAGTVFAALSLLGNGMSWEPALFTAMRGVARGAGLVQAVYLVAGALRLRDPARPTWARWAAGVCVVLGFMTAYVSSRPLPALLDVALRVSTSATVGAAAVAAAYWIRRVEPQGMGTRLMAAGLLLYAFLKLFTPTTLGRLGLLEGIFAAPAVYLGFSLGPIAFALGLVVSLLEDRQRALAVERDRLRVSEEMFATLFRSSPDAILVTIRTEAGLIVAANHGFERVFGHAAAEAVGQTTMALGLFRPDSPLLQAQAARSRHLDVETEGYHKCGRRLALAVSAEEIEIGGELHTISVIRDVTERLEVQQALRRAERMAAVGAVVAGVAHEVRNPLFGISANLDALEHISEHQVDNQFIGLLRTQVNRLSELMSDLLDYGRPPALKLRREGLHDVVTRAVATSARAAERAGITLATVLDPIRHPLEIDAGRLEQVFENLLSNAIHHSPRGATVRIRVSARQDASPGVLCSVEDDGPGLAPDDLPRVFEPFFSRRKGGTGLGLAIVQQIIESHNGRIQAANRPEGGAMFQFFLPLARETVEYRASVGYR